jgi:hypothetical protein
MRQKTDEEIAESSDVLEEDIDIDFADENSMDEDFE